MKKNIFTVLAVLTFSVGASAQGIQVYNGNTLVETFANDQTHTYKALIKKSGTMPQETTKVTGIKITGYNTIYVGSNAIFSYKITPSNATTKTVTWTSSNTDVATVDETGAVKGIAAGEATITATANDGSGQYCTYKVTVPSTPNLLSGDFSVGYGKKVNFTKSNIYWDGTAFQFEENQTDCKTEWNESHVGHLYWTKDYTKSYTSSYDATGATAADQPFFAESTGGLTIGSSDKLYALSQGEWLWLINGRTNASSLKVCATVGEQGYCLILAPDNFPYSLKSSYTVDEVNNLGLICLPVTGYRWGTSFYRITDTTSGYYWTSTPGVRRTVSSEDFSWAWGLSFGASSTSTANISCDGQRNYARPVRLVRTIE